MSLVKIKKLKTCLYSVINQTIDGFNAKPLLRLSCFKGLNLSPCATSPMCLHKIPQSS